MLYFTRWKAIAVILTALIICLCAVPNFFPEATVKSWPEIRAYVFARERNVCRCCRKRRAESMHEIVFRSAGGKVSKTNSIAVCGDGVRGCHGFMQRHEISVYLGERGAEATIGFKPRTELASEWLLLKQNEYLESPVMVDAEAE